MRNNNFLCLFFKIFLLCTCLFLPQIASCQKKEPLLVLDEPLNLRLPRNFRTALDVTEFKKFKDISTEGLTDLKMSASGQFSWKTLNAALTHMSDPVWVVDLRQESHGYLNGRPISWYGDRNAENNGKSLEEILVDEKSRLAVLRQYSTVKIHKIIDKRQGEIIEAQPIRIRVVKIETEPMLLARMKVAHVRIPVRDHFPPSDEQVDRFIQMMNIKTPDTWIHYHCRAGKGRATTFMIMHDIVHNAKKVSLEEIAKRQNLIGGSDLLGAPKPGKAGYAIEAANERKIFLQNFYNYVKDPKGYGVKNYSNWKAVNL
jgi:hypothetical protein